MVECHGLTKAVFANVNVHLADEGITLRSGTLVDATTIDAPSSTKNQAKARDPGMSSTKKGNDWHFGMKAHGSVRNHHIRRSGEKNGAEAAENETSKAAKHPQASASALAKPLIRHSIK